MELLFEVVAGADPGTRLGAPGPEVVIGRDPAASDVVLTDPRVSRRHAIVRAGGAGLTIEDLGSSGGTTVNGAPVTGETPLAAGDVVRLGDTELRVVAEVDPGHAPTVAGPMPPPSQEADAAAESAEAAAAARPPGRARLVLIPLALFVGVSLAVYGLARAHVFEKEASAAPVTLGDAAHGQAVFQATCSGCHGAQAQGGVGPALAGNTITVATAAATIRAGRGIMPAGLVTGADEADVLAYLQTIFAK
jgi:mono/diheme cytochrome c family protein